MTELALVVLVGLGSLAIRASGIVLLGGRELSEPTMRALRLVAPAVLGGLVAQTLLLEEGTVRALDSWHVAALVAGVVGWRTESVAATLGSGLLAAWVAGLWLG